MPTFHCRSHGGSGLLHGSAHLPFAPLVLRVGLDGDLQAPRGVVLDGRVDVHQDREASVGVERTTRLGGWVVKFRTNG